MDTRILYAKHAWRVAYRSYLAATSRRARKMRRQQMRQTVMAVLAFMKEARDG